MNYYIAARCLEGAVGTGVDLLSFALVAGNGAEFYAQNVKCDLSKASFIDDTTVIPALTHARGLTYLTKGAKPSKAICKLEGCNGPTSARCPWQSPTRIAFGVADFVGKDPSPVFVGFKPSYAWVMLCQLFGGEQRLPSSWVDHPLDAYQRSLTLGGPIAVRAAERDNALSEAKWVKRTWESLNAMFAVQVREGILQTA